MRTNASGSPAKPISNNTIRFLLRSIRRGTRRKLTGTISSASPITIISASPAIRAVKAAALNALEEQGVGALASRLVGGQRSTHHILEDKLASFLGVEIGSHAGLRLSDQCDDDFAHDEHA